MFIGNKARVSRLVVFIISARHPVHSCSVGRYPKLLVKCIYMPIIIIIKQEKRRTALTIQMVNILACETRQVRQRNGVAQAIVCTARKLIEIVVHALGTVHPVRKLRIAAVDSENCTIQRRIGLRWHRRLNFLQLVSLRIRIVYIAIDIKSQFEFIGGLPVEQYPALELSLVAQSIARS